MLTEISNEILIPIGLPITDCESTYAVPTGVRENLVGTVNNLPSSIPETTTEVDIFKPYGVKSLIETVDLIPCLALYRKTRPCRLINLLCITVIEVEASVTHIPGVARPNVIYQ